MKRRIRKILLAAAVLVSGWCVFLGISIWNFGSHDHASRSDCIIVLGAAAYGAKPSPVFEQRIRHGIELFQKGKAPVIIFTGGRGDGASHSESEVGELFAIAEGVSRAAIVIEEKSRTTLGNLIEAKAIMEGAGFDSAMIVSDPLHLKRASVMAEDLGMVVVTSPTPTSRYRSARTKIGFLLREIFFYSYYLATGD